jgi:hypothetical protein
MPRQSGRQKEIVGRVMHEYNHGELETRGRKVRNPRQAIAIGLSEAGASRKKSPAQNTRSRRRTEDKERKGQTAQQQKEGRASVAKSRASVAKSRTSVAKSRTSAAKSRVAPKSRKAASKASRATARTTRSASRTPARGRAARGEPTRAQLYAETKRRGMHGCSRLSKADLARALRRH